LHRYTPGPRPAFPKFYPVLSDMSFKERLHAAEEAEVEAALAAQYAAVQRWGCTRLPIALMQFFKV
jgi:hypothetical protein